MIEVAIGGTKDQKLEFVKEKIGKSISISEVFPSGLVDVRGVTTRITSYNVCYTKLLREGKAALLLSKAFQHRKERSAAGFRYS